ncbi:MAG TPA: 6-phosphofructokinase [Firmicutes bacterium]|nr:6-phosphofructokinase [Bacillota bacterium]
MATIKRIGVLTGGGDCPGLNPAIRAVVIRARDYGYEVLGIQEGWAGLVKGDARPIDVDDVREIISVGGTVLGTSRTNPYKNEEDKKKAIENVSKLGLDALVAIGGDDTLGVANKLSKEGVPCVGVPKTMDNDVSGTDYCIGFDTAVSVAIDALERLKDTARSHRRIMVLEVMGREAGWVALMTGMAGGADWIMLPEFETDLDEMCRHLVNLRSKGRLFGTVVVSEAVRVAGTREEDQAAEVDAFGHTRLGLRGVGAAVADIIKERTGISTRSAAIGHIQRGGTPVLRDRYLPTRLGLAAVDMVKAGKFGMMPAVVGEDIKPVALEVAVGKTKTVPVELWEMAKSLFK